MVVYALLPEIAVQAWNVITKRRRKEAAPNSSGGLFCADRISKDLLR